MPEREGRSGRETRLLALVILIALAALLVLARFRFPAADLADVRPSQGPLDRLVARSTYEDLAASMANLVQRVSSAVVVLQLQPTPTMPEETPARGAAPPDPAPPVSRLVPGARLTGDLALVHVPPGFEVAAGQGLSGPVEVLQVDEARGLALVRAPSVLEISSVTTNAIDGFTGFSFVGVVEAAIGGVTAQPAFMGRADVSADPRWPQPVVAIGGSSALPVGALIFALDGRFIGMVAELDDGHRALVPAGALSSLAEKLQQLAAAPAPGKNAAAGLRRRGGGR